MLVEVQSAHTISMSFLLAQSGREGLVGVQKREAFDFSLKQPASFVPEHVHWSWTYWRLWFWNDGKKITFH